MYEPAAANAAMVHVVHSLRGLVVDLAEKIGVDERVGAVA